MWKVVRAMSSNQFKFKQSWLQCKMMLGKGTAGSCLPSDRSLERFALAWHVSRKERSVGESTIHPSLEIAVWCTVHFDTCVVETGLNHAILVPSCSIVFAFDFYNGYNGYYFQWETHQTKHTVWQTSPRRWDFLKRRGVPGQRLRDWFQGLVTGDTTCEAVMTSLSVLLKIFQGGLVKCVIELLQHKG